MKAKYLLLGLGALVALGGLWYGRQAWRAHRQLVTLQVRNAPLREVLHKIERQTATKIRAEQNLDARITLNVTDKPLAYLLARLSEQAGARWVTLYAVYDSAAALRKLESALQGDGKLEAAGWVKIAPNALALRRPGPDDGAFEASANGPLSPGALLESNLPPGAVVATEDVVVGGPAGSAPRSAGAGPRTGGAGSARVMVVRRGGPGGAMEEEIWTPEELIMDSALKRRRGGEEFDAPTPEAATELAKKVQGKWTTYYALRKSRLGVGLAGMQGAGAGTKRLRFAGPGQAAGGPGTNGPVLEGNAGSMHGDIEADLQRQRYAEFGRLTPEQRVQRARDRQALKAQSPQQSPDHSSPGL